MKLKLTITALALVAAHSAAHAWFFFWIPTGAISDKINGIDGDHCVGGTAKVGDNLRLNTGEFATVKTLYGTSDRCGSAFPIRAKLDIVQPPDDMFTAESVECIDAGSRVGDRITLRDIGPVVVRSISPVNTQCGSTGSKPMQATVAYVPKNAPGLPSAPQSQTQNAPSTSPPLPSSPPAQIQPTVASTSAESSPAVKLRELNGMLKDGLITQQDYDAKKSEILKAF